MASNYKDLHVEVALDLDNLSHELSRKLSPKQLCKFVQSIVDDYANTELDEALFLAQLKNMISYISQCPEDYEGTKWEMLPAMAGLLNKDK